MSLDREELFADLAQPIEAWDAARRRIQELFIAARQPLLDAYYAELRAIEARLMTACSGLIEPSQSTLARCLLIAPPAAKEEYEIAKAANFVKCCEAQKPLVAAQEAAVAKVDAATQALFSGIAAVVNAVNPFVATANDEAIRAFETFLTTKETHV